MENQIQIKLARLITESKLLGAAIRFPTWQLALGYRVSIHYGDQFSFSLTEDGEPKQNEAFPAVIPIPNERAEFGYRLTRSMNWLWLMVERRPQRRKEFERNIQLIEAWFDKRLFGLVRFEADLQKRQSPLPFSRKFAK